MTEDEHTAEAGSEATRSIAGQVAIVTGAASGMGRATTRLLAAEGARVGAIDLAADDLAATVDLVESDGGTAVAWPLDVTDRDAVEATVAAVVERFGPVDILVNCAGVSQIAPLDAPDYWEAWDRTLAVNLTAYAAFARACRPHLVRAGSGRIVNIASTEGLMATPGVGAYTASKHGVIGLTRSLAAELGPAGVTVNAVCPGPINTGMTAFIGDDDKARFARRRVPLRRYGEPEEVAHAILGLVLPAMSYVNGAVLTVDGGQSAKAT